MPILQQYDHLIIGAVLDNEIYLRWHDEEKPVKLAQTTAADGIVCGGRHSKNRRVTRGGE